MLLLSGVAYSSFLLSGFLLLSEPKFAVDPALLKAAKEEGQVVVYGAMDQNAVAPLIQLFEKYYPTIRVKYHDLQSQDIYSRFLAEISSPGRADVLWSSAMDLQIKLVNDGHAQAYASPQAAAIPGSLIWRDEAFGTTYEPIVWVYDRRRLSDKLVPRNRRELIAYLEKTTDKGQVLAYDAERSGLGFLLHTQDAETSPALATRLAEVFRRSQYRPYRQTADMLDALSNRQALLAYNLIGSYALELARNDPAIGVVLPNDYTLVMSRVMFISRYAPHGHAARLWLDFVLSVEGQRILAKNAGLYSVRNDISGSHSAAALRVALGPAFRPIAIGAGLLTYLDRIKRHAFLKNWIVTPRPAREQSASAYTR